MEQVAEALKQLMADGQWKPGVDGNEINDKIIAWTNDEYLAYLEVVEIMVVLEAIISIYGKKSPVIEWHDRTDSGLLVSPQKFDWEHDITGDLYDNMYFLEKRFPEHASKWADGVFGGNCFKVGDEKFITTEATRGIGYTALIAFDQFGNGAVFVKDKL